MGVDGPDGRRADLKAIFEVMRARGLTQYRVAANLARDTDPYEVQMYRDMLALAKTYGITLKPILATPFAWGDRTDGGKYPAGDWNALYQQAYSRTYTFVINFKDQINDWEMGNEINLLALDSSGKKLYGHGWTAEEFDIPVMNDWVAVLKGMSDAIDKINREHGTHLRRVLNTTSTMFGFLDFMASKGVGFDVISYHYYESSIRIQTAPGAAAGSPTICSRSSRRTASRSSSMRSIARRSTSRPTRTKPANPSPRHATRACTPR